MCLASLARQLGKSSGQVCPGQVVFENNLLRSHVYSLSVKGSLFLGQVFLMLV